MRYLALAWAAAHALQHPGARRRRATPCAALSAADEFVVKVGVVDALRGVAYTDEDDVVAAGVVAGVRATSAELGVELALAPKDDADAIVAACAAAARACRDALVADGTLDAACEVRVTDAAAAAAPAPAPAADTVWMEVEVPSTCKSYKQCFVPLGCEKSRAKHPKCSDQKIEKF